MSEAKSGVCRNCGQDQYQDEDGLFACKACPEGFTTDGTEGNAKCDKISTKSFLADVLTAILVFCAIVAVSRWIARKYFASPNKNKPGQVEKGGDLGHAVTTSPPGADTPAANAPASRNRPVQVVPMRSPTTLRPRPKIDGKAQMRFKARAQVRRMQTMSRVPSFSMLSERSIDALLAATQHNTVKKNEVVCRQGELADSFSVVVSGTFAVSIMKIGDRSGQQRRLGTLGEGDFFGEACLASSARLAARRKAGKGTVTGAEGGEVGVTPLRSLATITAESDGAQLLSLSRVDIDRLIRGSALQEADVAAGAYAKRIAWQEKLDRRRAERDASRGDDGGVPQRINTAVML
jgi:CRP-like cAMP-binding protein